MPINLRQRDLLKLIDFTTDEINYLIDLGIDLKKQKRLGIINKCLNGKSIAIMFQKNSTRTRCAFEVAAAELGMHVTFIDSQSSQFGTKESVEDTAIVLSRFYDGIEFRGFKQSDVEALAKYSTVPVWNGLTDDWHPTQMIADMMTVKENFGHCKGLKMTFFGDARNNVANSLMVISAKLGMHYTACGPKSMWPKPELVKMCQEIAKDTGAIIECSDDPQKSAANCNVIYTDVWVSMGEPFESWGQRIKEMCKFQVNMDLMKVALNNNPKGCIFLHCLPAFHGLDTEYGRKVANMFGKEFPEVATGELEVTDAVIKSKYSKAYDEAENRMHSIKAIMLSTIGN